MPCRSYEDDYVSQVSQGTYDNLKSEMGKVVKKANRLTAENDELREIILSISSDEDYVIPEKVLKKVGVDQIKHRKEDLKRLEAVFRKSKNAEKLGLVLLADPTKTLDPQLGFSPDDY